MNGCSNTRTSIALALPTALLVACAATAPPTTPIVNRATAPAFQVLYLLPQDAPDHSAIQIARIIQSVESAQDWFERKTQGHRFRMVEQNGTLSVQTVRLPRTGAEYTSEGDAILESIEFDLWAQGFSDADRIYLGYYAGAFPDCARASHPPTLAGNLAVLAPGTTGCLNGQFPGNGAGEWEVTLVHEIFHTLGAVSHAAPGGYPEHADHPGHVCCNQSDLMNAPYWDHRTIEIDVLGGNYWRDVGAGVVDISTSRFLDPTPLNSTMPPDWPVVPVESLGLGTPAPTSSIGGRPSTLVVANRSDHTIAVHWIDSSGVRHNQGLVKSWQRWETGSHDGHVFVITDLEGRERKTFRLRPASENRFVFTVP